MKYEVSEKKIYTTTNYDIFKNLKGNREVKNARAVKAIESINEFGWLTDPILVNEKLEVIDGQGRLEALRRLGLPVEFIIEDGIGIKECKGLNRFQKNWTTMDYIDACVSEGNENYIWLKSLLQEYKVLTKTVIFSVAASCAKSSQIGSAEHFKQIESGELVVPKSARPKVDEALFYLSRFSETVAYFGGRKDKFYTAVMFLYLLDSVDNERLCTVVNNARYDGLVTSGTVQGYLQQFEILYNKNLAKGKRIDAVHEFKIA